MAFHNNSELVDQLVQAVAATAPQEWTKFVFYFEFLEDEKIGLRNAHTGRSFGGGDYGIRLDDFDLGGSMRVLNACEALFSDSRENGNKWAGALLVVLADGRFKCRSFYDDTPLLNNDYTSVDNILSAGLSDLP